MLDIRTGPQAGPTTLRPGAGTAPPQGAAAAGTSAPVERVKDEYEPQAAIHDAGRTAGNRVSAAFTGVVGHVAGNTCLVPGTVVETYRNLWRAETIGPYAKTIGSMVALAGIPLVAGGALLASPFLGVAEAFRENGERDSSPLVQRDTNEVAGRITGSGDEPHLLLGKAIREMREFGDKKLAPGEEPWDIPLDKIFKGALDGLNFLMVRVPVTVAKAAYRGGKAAYRAGKTAAVESAKFAKTYGPKLAMAAVAGITSTLIAGPAGLVIGMGVSAVLAARDIKHAITDKDRSLGSRLGGVAKTLAYLPVGPVMAGISIKEDFGRSFVEGWEGKPLQAIATTGRAVVARAKEALHPQKGDAQ